MTYPTIMPALTLDFQNSQQLDPRVTFSRTQTTGQTTYINSAGQIAYAAEHEPRFDHDGNGECLGLLVEEARTNSVTASGDVKTAASLTQTGTSSYVTGIAPDGSSSTTLTNWVPDSGATGNALYGIASPGTPAAASVFIKANGWNYGGLWFNNIDGSADGKIFIDLTTGEVLSDANMSNITVVKCANGWWRVGGSSSTNALGTLSIKCSSSSGSSVTPAMNGTDGILLWGLQTESGTFVTSLIPTSGSTVTRSADIAQMTGDNFSSWYNQSEGTLFAQWVSPDTKQFSSPAIIKSSTVKNSPRIYVYAYQGNKLVGMVKTPSESATILTTSNVPNTKLKTAIAYNTSSQSSTFNGNTPQSANISTAIPTMIRMDLGDVYSTNDRYSNHHIARVSYYNQRLTDAELQTLTS